MKQLTDTEKSVLKYVGYAYAAKEIADKMDISVFTAQVHIRNIKEKLGLYKNMEITAFYWCNKVGIDFVEKRDQFAELAKVAPIAMLTLVMSLSLIGTTNNNDRRRISFNRGRITRVVKVQTSRNLA